MSIKLQFQSIWDRIEHRRSLLGLTHAALAKKAGVAESVLRNIRDGKSKNPRSDTLGKIAAALETTEAWLIREDENQKNIPPTGADGAAAARNAKKIAIELTESLVSLLKSDNQELQQTVLDLIKAETANYEGSRAGERSKRSKSRD